ncbi:MAG: trans-sulfuration enzyme family protein [Actinomycetes bacterium]
MPDRPDRQDRPHRPGAPGEHTRGVHLPAPPEPAQRPLGQAVWRSSAYAFTDSDEYAAVLGGEREGYAYARVANPGADGFAAAVAALEAGPRAQRGAADPVTGEAFTSGMAAITASMLALTGAGAHVVASREVYGGTYALLTGLLARFGVETTLVDTADTAAVEAAVRPGSTRVVYAETLANPTMSVPDLPALAEVAHRAGAVLVVDSTFASPVVCRPLALGVDLVVHSATKYLGGHSDATGGVVVGRPDLVAAVREVRVETGGVLAPDEAFLLRRGLATLVLRVDRQCRSALALATVLAAHPQVARVDHPGLPGSPYHERAARLFLAGEGGTRYGAVVTVTPHGGREAGQAFADRLCLASVATSLGGVHTVAGHVASTSHRQLDDEALADAGIAPAAVRISVGLEDPDDLVADVTAALADASAAAPGR